MIFFFLGRVNLVQKFKRFSSLWNLIPRLFRIYQIRVWWSLFCFGPFFFVQKIHLAFWYYLINLAAVYSQRLQASSFLVQLELRPICWNLAAKVIMKKKQFLNSYAIYKMTLLCLYYLTNDLKRMHAHKVFKWLIETN